MANLSKIKREKMLEYLEKLKVQNNDDENIRAITEIEMMSCISIIWSMWMI
ncbi:hypothetical protein [uncultured Granulicatella sp.]|uniref:hypothetical protein n=1 Tax=uncultured Granulicatella sp. TaxID=316089 RepID=UPI0028D550A6|nr:hypothetical protein [uncultured Granulicatella sp.]